MNPHIPIFIIVHDRLIFLQRVVKSYEEKINYPIKIVFHDVASTFQPCIDYLADMENEGYTVYRTKVNNHHTVVNSIKDYMKKHDECEYFVITDPDIELDNTNEDILQFYIHLSVQYNNKLVIGPMLKIDDIPDCYPYKKTAIQKHKGQFWNKKPISYDKYNNETYDIQKSLIDTTFQLVHRSLINTRFPRAGIRTYAPYDARHLDWYLDPNNLTDDQIYYSNQANKNISHWGINLIKK